MRIFFVVSVMVACERPTASTTNVPKDRPTSQASSVGSTAPITKERRTAAYAAANAFLKQAAANSQSARTVAHMTKKNGCPQSIANVTFGMGKVGPWGHVPALKCDGKTMQIVLLGADGKLGTDDDIASGTVDMTDSGALMKQGNRYFFEANTAVCPLLASPAQREFCKSHAGWASCDAYVDAVAVLAQPRAITAAEKKDLHHACEDRLFHAFELLCLQHAKSLQEGNLCMVSGPSITMVIDS